MFSGTVQHSHLKSASERNARNRGANILSFFARQNKKFRKKRKSNMNICVGRPNNIFVPFFPFYNYQTMMRMILISFWLELVGLRSPLPAIIICSAVLRLSGVSRSRSLDFKHLRCFLRSVVRSDHITRRQEEENHLAAIEAARPPTPTPRYRNQKINTRPQIKLGPSLD